MFAGRPGPIGRRPAGFRGEPRPNTSDRRRASQTSHETSAGGVAVRIEHGLPYVAVIKRKNRSGRYELCLPKGHLERGESATEAAVREVAEETGIRTRVICHISSVDYWFSGTQTRIHKMVHHFLLEYLDGDITAENDPDHEAEEALWLPLRDAVRSLSYANERRVVRAAIELLYPERQGA